MLKGNRAVLSASYLKKGESTVMKLSPAISKIIAPMFEEVGYSLYVLGRGDYVFQNGELTRNISFDHDKYAKKEVRVHFMAKSKFSSYGGIMFYLQYLKPDFFPPIPKQDDNEYLRDLTAQIISIVLPYMDLLVGNQVRLTRDMYEDLSQDTEERAQRFAKKFGLSPEYNEHGQAVDEILWSMQPDIQRRRESFYENLQDVLDLAAYAGECLNLKNGSVGQWYWDDRDCYCIRALGYDVLNRVVEAWAAGREIINYSLKGVF